MNAIAWSPDQRCKSSYGCADERMCAYADVRMGRMCKYADEWMRRFEDGRRCEVSRPVIFTLFGEERHRLVS